MSESPPSSGSKSGRSTTPSPFMNISDETLFFGGSFALFGVGMLLGTRGLMKREKFMLGFRSEHIGLATQALMYGTALSVGTFGVGTLMFMHAADISTPKEFAQLARKKMNKIESIKPGEEAAKDIEEKNKMSNEEEMSYWYALFFSPRTAEEDEKNAAEEDELKKINQNESAKKLSIYDRHFNRPKEPGTEKRQSLWQQWTSDQTEKRPAVIDSESVAKVIKRVNLVNESTERQETSLADSIGFQVPTFREEQVSQSLWSKHVGNNNYNNNSNNKSSSSKSG